MHQFLTILVIFNVMLIFTIQIQPIHAFNVVRHRMLYGDICDAVDESEMKMLKGECVYGNNQIYSDICDKKICYQGPGEYCNDDPVSIIKCNEKLQCVKNKCSGCIVTYPLENKDGIVLQIKPNCPKTRKDDVGK